MSWEKWLADGRLARHRTSLDELAGLRSAIARNLSDAALNGLSADNRFGLAYEAALLAAKMAVAAAGYRVKSVPGAHRVTFEAMARAMGPSVQPQADYLELARRKRNDLSYDSAGIVTAKEADEILREAARLNDAVERWLVARRKRRTHSKRP